MSRLGLLVVIFVTTACSSGQSSTADGRDGLVPGVVPIDSSQPGDAAVDAMPPHVDASQPGDAVDAMPPHVDASQPGDAATGTMSLTVDTNSGKVAGAASMNVVSWKGIPFAAPPVGARRWTAPASPAPWSGVRDATQLGSACIQPDGSGSEDCLFLNVWSPSAFAGTSLPVIVFIHGGDWVLGSGGLDAYDGSTLAGTGAAVVVTLNYRLGALGFLAHTALAAADASGGTGNYGLLDQRAALEWVKSNIAAFGGDPARVLLWGQSAGGWSVLMHMVSPGSAGLFARGFSQSGGTYAQPLAQAEATGVSYGNQLGCAQTVAADQIACLRGLPAATFATAPNNGFFDPVIDGVTLVEPLMTTFAAGKQNAVPLLIGNTKTEFTYPGLSATPAISAVTSRATLQSAVTANFGAANTPAIMNEYLPTGSSTPPATAYLNILDDAYMNCPTRGTARTLTGTQTAPVWRYLFAHGDAEGPLAQYGPGHYIDVPYWFGTFASQGFTPSATEQTLGTEMRDYLLQFAATGDPNTASSYAWPTYDATHDSTIKLDTPLASLPNGVNPVSCDFWDQL